MTEYCTTLTGRAFFAVMRQLQEERHLRVAYGDHWATWFDETGKEVAGYCTSPYPGPEYGSSFRVRSDLVEYRTVTVPTSRDLTWTEAHILNNRLFNNKDKDVSLLREVEDLYSKLSVSKPSCRLGKGSYAFIGEKNIRIIKGKIHG
jgi:hypothetical protein